MTVAGEPISQLCRAQYSGVTSLSATSGSCFKNWMTPTFVSKGRKYSRIIRPIIPPTDNRQASASVSAAKISRTRRQSARLGPRPGRGGRGFAPARQPVDALRVAGDVAGIEVEAHRQEAVLAGELEGIRTLADPGDADRRIGFLKRPDMGAQALQHQVGLRHLPVFACVIEGRLLGPQL